MFSNDDRTKEFCIVINQPLDYIDSTTNEKKVGYIYWSALDLCNLLNVMYPFYALILHDCDLNDNGELKLEHFHLVIRRNNIAQFSTVIKELSRMTGYPKNCISVKPCYHFNKCLRYLTHIDDSDKYQYNDLDVYTNHREILERAWECSFDYIDFDFLAGVCYKNNGKITKIIRYLGIDVYNKYWRIIDKIINSDTFPDDSKEYFEKMEDLPF